LRSSDSYARFHKLLAASVSQSASNAAAYEQEKRRAEALAELDRAKTTFFTNVSHEFRTPLTLMLGPLADLLAEASISGPAARTLELIHRNGLRLLKLVNTLLDVSRLEAGGVEGVFEPIDLSAATREVASMFAQRSRRPACAWSWTSRRRRLRGSTVRCGRRSFST
jgi:signal transduction histidine kinase